MKYFIVKVVTAVLLGSVILALAAFSLLTVVTS